jgi:hypothetical protein
MNTCLFCVDIGGTSIKSALVPTPIAGEKIPTENVLGRLPSTGVLNHSLPSEIAMLFKESCRRRKVDASRVEGIRISITGEVSACGTHYNGHLKDRGVPGSLARHIARECGVGESAVRLVTDSTAWAIGFTAGGSGCNGPWPAGVLCLGTGVGFAVARTPEEMDTMELSDEEYDFGILFQRAGHGKAAWEVHNHLGRPFFQWADGKKWDRCMMTSEFSARVGLLLSALHRAYPSIRRWALGGGHANFLDPAQVWSDSRCRPEASREITLLTDSTLGHPSDWIPLIGAGLSESRSVRRTKPHSRAARS